MTIPAILVNYNYEPTYLKDYPNLVPTIYDRSDDNVDRNLTQYGGVYRTENRGDVDRDKLGWLIEHYNNLPDVFLWGKSNLFKYVDEEQLKKALENPTFTPLFKRDHRTYSDKYGIVARYHNNMYEERADSWMFNPVSRLDNSGRFYSWQHWCQEFGLPMTHFIPFAPGGNYILTRERVHNVGRDMYIKMRDTLGYAAHPVEAHCCERSYFYLWRT